MSKENYRKIAKKLGAKYLFGRWGLTWFPKDPAGHIRKVFQVIPLDGWVTDNKEVVRIMRERGLEL